MSHLRAFFDRKTLLSIGLLLCFFQASGAWALSSYAIGATDEIGSTGSASVGLGVPDYGFTNDLGIGLAGWQAFGQVASMDIKQNTKESVGNRHP